MGLLLGATGFLQIFRWLDTWFSDFCTHAYMNSLLDCSALLALLALLLAATLAPDVMMHVA